MYPRNHLLALVTIPFALVGLGTPAQAALVEYDYTGNLISNVTNPGTALPGANHVTIQFTIDDSLVPKNGFFGNYSVISTYHFSDGTNVIDSNPPKPGYSAVSLNIKFATDANGNVVGPWIADATQSHPVVVPGWGTDTFTQRIQTNNGLGYIADSSTLTTNCCGGFGSYNTNDPGIWTRSIVPSVPEPEEWAMLIAGIPLVGWQIRRKQRL
jgi:hypothetical protein